MFRWLILILVMGVANGAAIFNLNERQVIETYLSSRDFNRIAIEKDRITHMVFDRDMFVVVKDEVNGQIFVKPNQKTTNHPVSFTIITEKNKTQDWLFTFRDIKARTLILEDVKSKVVKSVNCQEQAVILLNKLVNKEKVKGIFSQNKLIPVKSPWRLKIVKQISKGNLRGYVLALQNTAKEAKEIRVADLWVDSVLAISLGRETVESGDIVKVVVVTDERGLLTAHDKHKKSSDNPFGWYTDRG